MLIKTKKKKKERETTRLQKQQSRSEKKKHLFIFFLILHLLRACFLTILITHRPFQLLEKKKTMFEQPSDALYCFEKDTNRCSGKKKKKREPNGKQKTVIMRSNVPSRSQFCSSQDTQSSLPRLSCLFIFFLFLFFFFLLAISKSSLSLQRKSRRLQRFSKFNGSVG